MQGVLHLFRAVQYLSSGHVDEFDVGVGEGESSSKGEFFYA
jgi:hypothetical protein